MRFLKHKEFLPFAPDTGFVRVNHDSPDCGGSSASMKIEVQHDGTIFAYCHRCSKSGTYSSAYFTGKKTREGDVGATTIPYGRRQRAQGYERASRDFADWSSESRAWVLKAGLSQVEVIANDIRYDKEIDGVFLSVHNGVDPCGYILRRFNYHGPKYINDFEVCTPRVHRVRPVHDNGMVVITEDILSAIKVGRQYNAVSILGTRCELPTLNWLIKTYSEFVIFLDDDSNLVRKQQRVLRNTLGMMGKAVIISGVGKDPKDLTNNEIQEKIDAFRL